jgi:hypothetical protein
VSSSPRNWQKMRLILTGHPMLHVQRRIPVLNQVTFLNEPCLLSGWCGMRPGPLRIIESSVPAIVVPTETVEITFDQGGFWSERRDLRLGLRAIDVNRLFLLDHSVCVQRLCTRIKAPPCGGATKFLPPELRDGTDGPPHRVRRGRLLMAA